MADSSSFDTEHAHKFFSSHSFNYAWELIEKTERKPEENEQMIQRALASLWHWTQRPDCTSQNLSIGYWQVSRVYALASEPDNACKYAQLCLDVTPSDDPFYLGYAHEAMARAQLLDGNKKDATENLSHARRCAEQVANVENRKLLMNDLNELT